MSHAVLGASSSKQWMACPPSVRASEHVPDKTSTYAEEGTFAHSVAEHKLNCYITPVKKSTREARMAKIQKDKYYTEDLEAHVDAYVDYVKEKINEAKSRTPDAIILLEQKLDFSPWVPEGFGTGDVVIISDGILDVIDLKFGQGTPVDAFENPQLMLYGLGAINNFAMLYDIDLVRMTIHQPRLNNVTEFEMKASDLIKWGEEVVKPKAEIAFKGEGEFCSGDHCKFCRIRETCRQRAEDCLELAKMDFKQPPLLTPEEIAEVLKKAENLQAWAKDIAEYALDQAVNHGVRWPGYKIVEGRSNRVITDKDALAFDLILAGFPNDKVYKPTELLALGELENTVGKKKFAENYGGYLMKPPGKPTLVDESDKRPELNTTAKAVEDFAAVVAEEFPTDSIFAGTKNIKEQHDKVRKVLGV